MKLLSKKDIRAKVEKAMNAILLQMRIKSVSKKTLRAIRKVSKKLSKAIKSDLKKQEKKSLMPKSVKTRAKKTLRSRVPRKIHKK